VRTVDGPNGRRRRLPVGAVETGLRSRASPGLDAIVAKNAAAGRLHFTTDLREAVENALAFGLAKFVTAVLPRPSSLGP